MELAFHQKDYPEVRRISELAKVHKTNDIESCAYEAKALYLEKNYEKALLQIRRFKKEFGKSEELINLEGLCLKKDGELSKAVALFENYLSQ